MPFLRIVVLAVSLSLAAAVLRDQVLVRISTGYFTFHPVALFGSDSLSVIALGRTLLASGWLALVYGLGMACAARLGTRPKRSPRDLRKPVLMLIALVAAFAALAGIFGYMLASLGTVILNPNVKESMSAEKWPGFQACWFVHTMGNYVGCIGGGMQIAYVWVSRKQSNRTRMTRIGRG